MCDYEDIEEYMRSLQPGKIIVTEYYPDDFELGEPDSFIGANDILTFSTHVRKYTEGNQSKTCDNYKTSKQILEEKFYGEEITEMLKDLNVFGRKKGTPKKPKKTTTLLIKKEAVLDLMPLLLDESHFKLKERNTTDSNTDSSRDGCYSKKEYTPREIYDLKRKK